VEEISFGEHHSALGYDSVMNFFVVEALGKKVDQCDSKRVIEREVWNVPGYSSIVPKYLVRSLVDSK